MYFEPMCQKPKIRIYPYSLEIFLSYDIVLYVQTYSIAPNTVQGSTTIRSSTSVVSRDAWKRASLPLSINPESATRQAELRLLLAAAAAAAISADLQR